MTDIKRLVVLPQMNDKSQQVDRTEVMFRNVRENARIQATPENRENYLCSCEAHGGDLANVVAVVKLEFGEA